MVIRDAMLCNRFLVAPQFCINSPELAELGELNYFLSGIGSYEAAFLSKNSLKIIVTVFVIFTLFHFPLKSKMAAKSGEN